MQLLHKRIQEMNSRYKSHIFHMKELCTFKGTHVCVIVVCTFKCTQNMYFTSILQKCVNELYGMFYYYNKVQIALYILCTFTYYFYICTCVPIL